ncbi:Holo-[acyl-carrier-protein] synthase [Pediococcus pentosaceus]|uniref:Holo-[acyl-carrier-protein] synthase n=1 Tax=Pediococcus pentosaceus TaxID=1255 RepID=A0A1Y0VLJ9_PEDPE|nr:Holo-[acyl-carrier-protein] synthase [Pediococcus pentosaceus]
MIYGIGIDITNIDRFKTLHNPATFIQKVLTPTEFDEFEAKKGQRAYEFLAGHFSVKESYSKAYGTGLGKNLIFKTSKLITMGLENLRLLNIRLVEPYMCQFPILTTML